MINLAQLEKELREKYPHMFTHSDLQPGEVWIGDQCDEVVHLNAYLYQTNGVPSTRVGKERVKISREGKEEVDGRSIFMNLKELLIANEKCKQEGGKE